MRESLELIVTEEEEKYRVILRYSDNPPYDNRNAGCIGITVLGSATLQELDYGELDYKLETNSLEECIMDCLELLDLHKATSVVILPEEAPAFKLTGYGENVLDEFVEECKKTSAYLVEHENHTMHETTLPTKGDIIADLEYRGCDVPEGIYWNAFQITDQKMMLIALALGTHFEIYEEGERYEG